jgi:hypothetical protein
MPSRRSIRRNDASIAAIAVVALLPALSSAGSHEPNGMMTVGPATNPTTALPPLQPAIDTWGQQHFPGQLQGPGGTGPRLLNVVTDANAPFAPGSFYRISIPAGFGGGDAPARWMLSSGFPVIGGDVQRLYLSFWIRYSAAYHSGSKLAFFSQRDGNNHYFILTNGGGSSEFEAVIQNQGWNFERIAASAPDLRRWNFIELLLETGDAGRANGIGRLWINGGLLLERTTFPFFANGTAARWDALWMDPTYGGPATNGEWIDLGHFYVSVGRADRVFVNGFQSLP